MSASLRSSASDRAADPAASLDQFSLLPDLSPPSPLADRPSGRLRRPPEYDQAVLEYIRFHETVTTHQVVYKFWILDGKAARYGFELIRRLVGLGYLNVHKLHKDQGQASRRLLTIAPVGLALIHRSPDTEPVSLTPWKVEHRLQMAEVLLERGVEGFRIVPPTAKWATYTAWIAKCLRKPAGYISEIERRRLERLTRTDLPVDFLVSPTGDRLRILLPVRRGRLYTKAVKNLLGLPGLGLIPAVILVDVVAPDPELGAKAVACLAKEAAEHGLKQPCEITCLDSYLMRPNPAEVERSPESAYLRHGVPSPKPPNRREREALQKAAEQRARAGQAQGRRGASL